MLYYNVSTWCCSNSGCWAGKKQLVRAHAAMIQRALWQLICCRAPVSFRGRSVWTGLPCRRFPCVVSVSSWTGPGWIFAAEGSTVYHAGSDPSWHLSQGVLEAGVLNTAASSMAISLLRNQSYMFFILWQLPGRWRGNTQGPPLCVRGRRQGFAAWRFPAHEGPSNRKGDVNRLRIGKHSGAKSSGTWSK